MATKRTMMTPFGGVVSFDVAGETYMTPFGGAMSGDISSGVLAALTGTALDTINEADLVAGGKTIIITLTGETWVT